MGERRLLGAEARDDACVDIVHRRVRHKDGAVALLYDVERRHVIALRGFAMRDYTSINGIAPGGIALAISSADSLSMMIFFPPSLVRPLISRKPRGSSRRWVHGMSAPVPASCREKSFGPNCRPSRFSRQPIHRQPFHARIPACFQMASLTE